MALEQVSRIDRLLVQNQLPLAEVLLDPIATNIKTKSELIGKMPQRSPRPGASTWLHI